MAIKLDALKGVLEPLVEGREDAASIIESVSALDVDPEEDVAAKVSEALAEADQAWNARFHNAFFNPAENSAAGGEVTETVVEEGDNDNFEAPDLDDLFETQEN